MRETLATPATAALCRSKAKSPKLYLQTFITMLISEPFARGGRLSNFVIWAIQISVRKLMFGKSETNGCKRLKKISPHTVNLMQSESFVLTDESLNDVFGISYNTWRKILRGDPVRSSLADRLERRVADKSCPPDPGNRRIGARVRADT